MATKTAVGLSPKTAAALSYLLGWLSGLFFLLTEKNDRFVRFHAMQSVITFGALTLLPFVPIIGIFAPLFWLLGFVLWLILMLKAYQGEEFQIPLVGTLARSWMGKIK